MSDATQRYLLLREAAATSHGLLHVRDLHALGFDGSSIAHAVERGRLIRVYPQVYAVGHESLGPDARRMAAVLRAGRGSAIGVFSAGRVHEMSRFRDDAIHVVTTRQVRPTPGLALHRTALLLPEHVRPVRGVPVTTRARTIVDIGAHVTAPQLANIMYRAAYFESDIGQRVSTILASMPRVSGQATTARAVALHRSGSSGTRSFLEDRYLALLQRARIRPGEHNVKVGPGVLDFEVDHIWRSALLVVEVDGFGHGRARARRIDAERTDTLRDHGFHLIRFTERDVRGRPTFVASSIRQALDGRRNRQRRQHMVAVE